MTYGLYKKNCFNRGIFFRGRFNIIWDKLLKDLATGKKSMIDLIEQATLAFDQREEWCLKVIALQKKAQNDVLAHTEVFHNRINCVVCTSNYNLLIYRKCVKSNETLTMI